MIRVYLNISDPAEYARTAELLWSEAELVPGVQDADVVIATPDANGDLPPALLSENAPPTLILANQPRPEWTNALPETVTPAELAAALRAVQAGLLVSHPSFQKRQEQQAGEEILTPRELEVLSRLAEGLPNKIIAHELGISDHTVKFHVAQILSKLRAGSRTEAVTAGLRLGIVHL
ncbi:helix-turn-helix transcriptional regulator [Bryobacterales bacterium F-183]|nr:helix-turn-helix transcriptional regulator [Bryobacterales bacterium F-183]